MIVTSPLTGREFIVAEAVLSKMWSHAQITNGIPESGGQLFAKFSAGKTVIELADGPHSADQRRRTFFKPSRKFEQMRINDLHGSGLHYIGDWHTHPEPTPSPSHIDNRTMRSIFRKSTHTLPEILLIIIGNNVSAPRISAVFYDQQTKQEVIGLPMG